MDYRGRVKILKRRQLKFNYRKSNLAKYIVISAILKLKKQNQKKINAKIKDFTQYRWSNQELNYPSAGCIFKNPLPFRAGKLIDSCGLKGIKCNGAEVSRKHANFIINKDKAEAKDVLKLIDYLKHKVESRFNLKLEPEIEIWK